MIEIKAVWPHLICILSRDVRFLPPLAITAAVQNVGATAEPLTKARFIGLVLGPRAARHRGGPRVDVPREVTHGNVWRQAGERPR